MTLPSFPTLPGLTFTSLKTPVFDTLINRAPNAYETRLPQTINPVWDWTLIYDFLRDFQGDPTTQFNLITELRTMMGFFNQMQGKAGSFLYTDPDCNAVGPGIVTTAPAINTYYLVGQGVLDPANHWQQCITAGLSAGTLPTWNSTGGNTTFGAAIFHDMGAGYSGGIPNWLAEIPLVTDGLGNYYTPLQYTLDGVAFEDVTDVDASSIAAYNNGVLQGSNVYDILGPGLSLPNAAYMGMYLLWESLGSTSTPGLSYTPGGSLGATTYYARTSYVRDQFAGDGPASNEASIAVPANNLLVVNSPAGGPGVSGYNVYVSTTSNAEQLQTVPRQAIGAPWTEPTSGLISGIPYPTVNSSRPFTPVTWQGNFYFRVRFDTDSQDFEKFLGIGNAASKIIANAGGGYWTVGGSNSQQGSGTLRLTSARPNSN